MPKNKVIQDWYRFEKRVTEKEVKEIGLDKIIELTQGELDRKYHQEGKLPKDCTYHLISNYLSFRENGVTRILFFENENEMESYRKALTKERIKDII